MLNLLGQLLLHVTFEAAQQEGPQHAVQPLNNALFRQKQQTVSVWTDEAICAARQTAAHCVASHKSLQ